MGIPYSKQINQAFDQVSPLVAATLETLHTSRNITYLLAAIQVITAILQLVTCISLFALLITLNPDLTKERKALVTPAIRYMASFMMPGSEGRWYFKTFGWLFGIAWLVGCGVAAWYALTDPGINTAGPEDSEELPHDGDEGGTSKPGNESKEGQ